MKPNLRRIQSAKIVGFLRDTALGNVISLLALLVALVPPILGFYHYLQPSTPSTILKVLYTGLATGMGGGAEGVSYTMTVQPSQGLQGRVTAKISFHPLGADSDTSQDIAYSCGGTLNGTNLQLSCFNTSDSRKFSFQGFVGSDGYIRGTTLYSDGHTFTFDVH